jgi:uncharacterized protein YbjQ (UPF0145 family)
MYVSLLSSLQDGRDYVAIGRVKAMTRWRASANPGNDAEREAAVRALQIEAEEFGADAVVDVKFEIDGVKGADIDGVTLQRVTVSGLAIRFAVAA